MTEPATTAAVTLPLEVVETLVRIAKEYSRQWAKPDSPAAEAIDIAEREAAQVREMTKGN